MRKIAKGPPPLELTAWRRKHPRGRYADLDESEAGKSVRSAIRQAALVEQYCLCAYCCAKITPSSSHNEHVVPQSRDPGRTVDFDNIVVSCNTKNQCGSARGNQPLPLTPLDPACETELMFKLSGVVEGASERATKSIEILKLN
ncbi:MAG: TIGR02646 family protein, partial [Magnetococcales bacterium]|nr:TIGR02646 family protein [Magnetococcales bacterium]